MAFPHFEVANTAVEMDIVRTLAAAGNGIHLVVTDSSGIASGRGRALFIEYTMDTAQTGTAGVRTAAINTTISADVPSVTGLDIYLAALGGANNYTVGNVIPLSIYVDDLGDNVSHFMALDIGINSSAATTGGESAGEGRHCFIRCREHSAIHATTSVIRLEGGNSAGHFLLFDNPAGTENSSAILEPHSDTEASDYRIRCHLEHYAIDRYIYLYPV